jgi:hypothetical protein
MLTPEQTRRIQAMSPQQLQELAASPSREEIEHVFRHHALSHRIDIETSSTVLGDTQRNQTEVTNFLTGASQYLQVAGPLVLQGVMPAEAAVDLLAAYSRSYRLGRSAETAIERMAEQARRAPQQQQRPDPRLQLEQAKMAHEKEMAVLDLQVKQAELSLKEREAQTKAALEERKAMLEMQIRQMEAQQEMELAATKAQQEMEIERAKAADAAIVQREHDEQAFRSREQRDAQAHAARAANQLRLDNERGASERGPKRRRMTVFRDKSGQIAGAEIDD